MDLDKIDKCRFCIFKDKVMENPNLLRVMEMKTEYSWKNPECRKTITTFGSSNLSYVFMKPEST